MLIAIPSKSRPFRSKSKDVLTSAIMFVPNNQLELYKKIYKEVEGIPDEVKGITKTRNWILKNYPDENIVFIDDDFKKGGYWIDKTGGGRRFVDVKDEEIWINEFEKLFNLTQSMGFKIWGAKTENSKISQHDEKPILFKTYITASCMGIVNDSEFYFDEDFIVKEDYEIGLRSIDVHGGVIGARYIGWENEHWGTNGGCGDYRTDKIERDCINRLIKKYPKYVKTVNRKNSQYCIQLNF